MNWDFCFEIVRFLAGTTKIKNLHGNIGSLSVKLTEDDVKEISDAVPIEDVAGDRNSEHIVRFSWKYANTPLRDGKPSAY